jgi:hypothetical protein
VGGPFGGFKYLEALGKVRRGGRRRGRKREKRRGRRGRTREGGGEEESRKSRGA